MGRLMEAVLHNRIDKVMEKARYSAFFALDAVKGGKVRERVLSDLKAWQHGTSQEETGERIRALIRHAVLTTSFYKDYSPETPLSGFPVVNKEIFRTRYEEFRSDLYRDAKDNRIMTTSGSTGTPFSMIQNRDKALYNTADSIFLSLLGGYRIGERIAFIRVWVDNVRKSRLQLFMENSLMMESSSLSDDSIRKMLDTIRKKHVTVITGYASALGEISRYIDEHEIPMDEFDVHAILPISEAMPDPVRDRLREQFRCSVRSYYSNEENGIMGIENADDNGYYINSETYYYEILKPDRDEPAAPGEPGRIVITDLTNYAFPIIRYDNGDMGVLKKTVKNGHFRVILTELYGRRSDMLYDTKGHAVTPFLITNHFWNAEGVRQYHFLQTGEKTYELRINGDPSLVDSEDLIGRIRPVLGEDAEIDVRYVEEIPVLHSGKRKYIENLYRK